jgi:hypothetical protein
VSIYLVLTDLPQERWFRGKTLLVWKVQLRLHALVSSDCSKWDELKRLPKVAENDPLFPDEVREEGLKLLQEKGIEHELKVYKGVPHGIPQKSHQTTNSC